MKEGNVIRLPFRPRLAPETGRAVDEWAKQATVPEIEARLNPLTPDRLDDKGSRARSTFTGTD